MGCVLSINSKHNEILVTHLEIIIHTHLWINLHFLKHISAKASEHNNNKNTNENSKNDNNNNNNVSYVCLTWRDAQGWPMGRTAGRPRTVTDTFHKPLAEGAKAKRHCRAVRVAFKTVQEGPGGDVMREMRGTL
jgi:hypothetical protein